MIGRGDLQGQGLRRCACGRGRGPRQGLRQEAACARFPKRYFYGGAVDAHGRILLSGNTQDNGAFLMRLRPRGKADRGFRNGLAGVEVGDESLETMYAGPRPLAFDQGGEPGCRSYCAQPTRCSTGSNGEAGEASLTGTGR